VTSRRDFIGRTAVAAAGLLVPAGDALALDGEPRETPAPRGFVDLLREPDALIVQTSSANATLVRAGAGRWTGDDGIAVTTEVRDGALRVSLDAPTTAIKRIYLRWRGSLSGVRLLLGDAWERAYGDLEWRGWVPDRVMPWYFATDDGAVTNAYGVRTSPAAFCYWQADEEGMSLTADVRSGSAGVTLGKRRLDLCDVVCRPGQSSESSFVALHAFCRQMCPSPRLPRFPIYGSNDWYWAYGKNNADTVRADAQHLLELAPSGGNRPFVVIDDGWQPGRGHDHAGAGTWDRGNEKFPDIAALAAELRRSGVRPGIWMRPLQAPADAPDAWRSLRDRNALDPSVPEVLHKIAADITRIREWGFDLVKHDYSTFDLFGRWGFQMGTALTRDGWTFATGSTRTNAEVISELYATIRAAAGDALVIGCNTVSHLSAGHFEICRIGDDTSGTEWARTRKMGVNSLAFRGAQHGAFYVADADCAAVTNAVPWSLGRQWLDLLSRSGTSLFVSLAPDALGPTQRADLRAALARAATSQPLAEPLDWRETVYPRRWRAVGGDTTYDWMPSEGAGLP
jgi:alpha-galactosidase